MAKLVWTEAREQARALVDAWGSDPYAICDALGIQVHTVALPSGVSGMIVKEEFADAEVFLSLDETEARRRFTCAHELGHFIERTQVARDQDFSFRDERGQKYDLHEFFADEFAGELLMPNPEFERKVERGARSVELARQYGVSVAAVEKRKERLAKNPDTRPALR